MAAKVKGVHDERFLEQCLQDPPTARSYQHIGSDLETIDCSLTVTRLHVMDA